MVEPTIAEEAKTAPRVMGGPRFETTPDVYEVAETPQSLKKIRVAETRALCVEQPCYWPIYNAELGRCKNHTDLYLYRQERKLAHR